MTKIFILVVNTKLTFNLVYNGLKPLFSSVTHVSMVQIVFVGILYTERTSKILIFCAYYLVIPYLFQFCTIFWYNMLLTIIDL